MLAEAFETIRAFVIGLSVVLGEGSPTPPPSVTREPACVEAEEQPDGRPANDKANAARDAAVPRHRVGGRTGGTAGRVESPAWNSRLCGTSSPSPTPGT